MSDKIGDGRDPYFYSGLNVMRNRLGIREAQRLEQAAWELTALRAATLELGRWPEAATSVRHSPSYLPGCLRLGGTGTRSGYLSGDTRFCHFEYIEKEGNALMQSLEDEEWLQGLGKEEFIERLARITTVKSMCCNPFALAMHCQRIFFEQLALHAGYRLDWRGVDRKTGVKRTRPGRWVT